MTWTIDWWEKEHKPRSLIGPFPLDLRVMICKWSYRCKSFQVTMMGTPDQNGDESFSFPLNNPLLLLGARVVIVAPMVVGARDNPKKEKNLIGSTGASGFGSKSTGEDVTAAARCAGATSGIGAETARVLAMRGARLVLPARSLKAAEETRARITGEFPGAEIIVLPLDLSSLSSVRCFVFRFLALDLPLNLLINNAGKFSYEHAVSEDGVEMTFATNYLGHFLLTKLLLNKMAETARETGIEGRIVNVSSSIHGWFFGDCLGYLDLMTRKKAPYDATRAYALSKLANVLHTRELTQRLEQMDANVTANCVHPGIVRTRLTRDREGLVTDLAFFLASKLLKTIPQAAATTCYAATHPRLEGVSGKYFADCNEVSPSSSASSPHEAARLWHASEAMTAPRPDRTWFGLEPPLSSDKPHDEM